MINYSDEIKALNIWEKISQISAEIEYLQKDDKVGFGNNSYKAISIEKVMTAVADKMNKYGVVIYPVEQEYSRKDEEVIAKDGTLKFNRISDVNVKYEVVNIHNPAEKIITVSSGTGVDTQDKGIGKAMTYAYKNMIIKLFAIATGDDTDKVHSDDYTKKLMGEDKSSDKTISPFITEQQCKLLYVKGKGKEDKVKEILKFYGFKDSKSITKDKFNLVLSDIEALQ